MEIALCLESVMKYWGGGSTNNSPSPRIFLHDNTRDFVVAEKREVFRPSIP